MTHLPAADPGTRLRRTAGVVLAHRLFASAVLIGVALRAVTTVAYQPALFFFGDSGDYLQHSGYLRPDQVRPVFYPAFLSLLRPFGNLAAIPIAQHLVGLAAAIVLYAALRRLGVGSVLGTLATLPILFDAYQLDIEQMVLAETLFELLVIAGLALMVMRPQPSARTLAAAGALLGLASITRTVGMVLIVPVAAFVIARRFGWRRLGAVVAGFGLPLLLYATWFQATFGSFAVTAHDGYFLYGRVATFADCSTLSLPPDERAFCDPRPPDQRPGANYYVWHKWRNHRAHRKERFRRDALLRDFAERVILHQPLDYVAIVLGDMAHYAAPGKSTGRRDEPIRVWQFPASLGKQRGLITKTVHRYGGTVRIVQPAARFLRSYQRYVYTPGPALVVALALALIAAALGWSKGRRSTLRSETLLFSTAGVALPLTAAMTSMFDYRYLLPGAPLLTAGGAIALTGLRQRMPALRTARGPAGAEAPGVRRSIARVLRRRVGPSTLRAGGGAHGRGRGPSR